MSVEELIPANRTSSRLLQQHLFSLLQTTKTIKQVSQIHTQIITNGLIQKNFIIAKLLSIYITCNNLFHATKVFERVQKPSTILWNQIIRGHACSNDPQKSVQIFSQMERSTARPDGYTYMYVLNGCVKGGLVREGGQVHSRVLRDGFCSNVFVQTNLLNLYVILGGEEGVGTARRMFDEMRERNVVVWNSLLSGCFRCGDVDEARRVFDEMPERNVVSWTTMIAGCAQKGRCKEAVALFCKMRWERVEFDEVTLVAVLSACAELGDLSLGKWIHSYVIESLCDKKQPVMVRLYNSLIHMYASSGAIEEAYDVFKQMPRRTTISWTSMITGFAKQGYAEEALGMFQEMERIGGNDAKPDEITFLGVLSACSHAGYVDEGRHYFRRMSETWGIEPKIEHYGCMVDLLSRAGLLDEAERLVESMPIKPNDAVWGALLGGCRIHKNVELASNVGEKLAVELDPDNAAGYFMLMSNVYSTAKKWKDVVNLRRKMLEMGVKKPPGRSWIQIDGVIHDFLAGDKTHKNASSIYEMLGVVTNQGKLQDFELDISEALPGMQD